MNAPAKIERFPAAATLDRPSAGKYKLRVEDYLLLHEFGSFGRSETELIDGDVLLMSPEWMPHMRIKDEIAYLLRRAIEALGLDLRLGTGGTVHLSDVDEPRPDVIVMRPVSGDKAVPSEAVVILVEVSTSTLTYDLIDKAQIYARSSVPEYWTVDVSGQRIHRWSSPSEAGYAEHQEIAFGQPISSAIIPSLTIDTSTL